VRVQVTTYFNCTVEELWEKVIKPASLQFVASPILTFNTMDDQALPDRWQVEIPYQLRLRLFGLIPMGEHTIKLVEIDRQTNTIRSRENGSLAAVWNHKITFRKAGPCTVRYTDDIEIRAGLLTPAIWLFAHLFYRHRQRRWKVLLNMDSMSNRVT
jgi:hypothetical protein